MKKIVAFTLIYTLFASLATAQWSAGVKIGHVSSDAIAENSISFLDNQLKSIDNLQYGLDVKYALSPAFQLYSGIMFTQRGFEVDQSTNFGIMGFDVPIGAMAQTEINYVEIPLLLQYNYHIGNLNLFATAGPSIARATSAHLRTKAKFIFEFNVSDTEINLNSDYIDRTDINLNAGLGVAYNFDHNQIFIETKYGRSMNSSINESFIDMSLYNKALQINVGYSYNF